jgi:hypothetical protein
MGLDPSTSFPTGTVFQYSASIPGFFNSFDTPSAIVNRVAADLSQEGYVVVNSSIGASSILDEIASLGGAPFTALLTVQDNNSGDYAGEAQAVCDLAFQQETGNAPTSSSIPTYTPPSGSAVNTGLSQQTAPATLGSELGDLVPSINLSGGSETLIAVVVIIVVLIVAVILVPEAPARVVKSFA